MPYKNPVMRRLKGNGYNRKWRCNHPEQTKIRRLKSRYGLTIDQYHQLLTKQDNKCSICHELFKVVPCVDHSHITGKIRGLLCKQCNTMIGMSYEKIEHLQNAILYLQKYQIEG